MAWSRASLSAQDVPQDQALAAAAASGAPLQILFLGKQAAGRSSRMPVEKIEAFASRVAVLAARTADRARLGRPLEGSALRLSGHLLHSAPSPESHHFGRVTCSADACPLRYRAWRQCLQHVASPRRQALTLLVQRMSPVGALEAEWAECPLAFRHCQRGSDVW